MVVCDLMSGNVLEELGFDQFQFNRTKNVPGGWSATLSHRDKRLALLPGLLEPWTRSIYLDMNGVILFGGILLPKSTDPESAAGATLGIGGEGFFTYYREGRRSIRGTQGMIYADLPSQWEVRFNQKDQFLIVADLLNHAAAYAGEANVGYDGIVFHGPGAGAAGPPAVPAGLTGRLRDRSYFTYENKGIGDAIEQLSSVIDGFEFSESYGWAGGGGQVQRFFDLWYPEKGQVAPALDLRFGLRSLKQSIDPKDFATRVISTGSGDKDAKLTVEVQDVEREYPDGAYPVIEKITDYSDVIEEDTLLGHAQHDLGVARIITQTLDVELLPVGGYQPGSIDWGNTMDVYVDDGDLQINDEYRLESMAMTVGREGETVITGTLVLEAQSCPEM